MEGLSHIMTQIFRYSQENKGQIEIDGYKNYSIDEKNQLITYQFDLQQSIRLDMLLSSIGVIIIRGGQALYLITKIIEKCNELEEQNLPHKNLTSDKIWLVLDNQSDKLKIQPSMNLQYKIYFTGYGQESTNYDPNFLCQDPCLQIIQILRKCHQKNEQLSELQDQLKDFISKRFSQHQIHEEINKILKKYGYSKKDNQNLKDIDQSYSKDGKQNQQFLAKIQQISKRFRFKEQFSQDNQVSILKQKTQQLKQKQSAQQQIEQKDMSKYSQQKFSLSLKKVLNNQRQMNVANNSTKKETKKKTKKETNQSKPTQKVVQLQNQFCQIDNQSKQEQNMQIQQQFLTIDEEQKLEKPVKQEIINYLIQQLNFENYLTNFFFPQILKGKNLSEKVEKDQFKTSKFEEIKQEKIQILKGKFRIEIIDKMDEILQQEFKINQSLINDEMLGQIIESELRIEQLVAMNSIMAAQQYLKKRENFDTFQRIKDKIKIEHRKQFIKMIDELIKNLK